MPVGLACLYPLLKDHDATILDLFWESDPEGVLKKVITSMQPQLVGLSIRNIDNQLCSRPEYYLPAVKRYVEIIKQELSIPIVVGGAGYSLFPHQALDYLGANWGIAGDGELSFPLLLRALERHKDPSNLPGLITPDRRGEGSILASIEDYAQIPLPAWETLRLREYHEEHGSLSILARRGCPYNCLYCDVPVREGHAVRGKNPLRLVDEIEAASRLNIAEVFVADNIFNYPGGYARAVAEEILRRRVKVKWSATLHPLNIDSDDIRTLRRSGFSMASLGADSGSPAMLAHLRKGFDIEEVSRLINLLRENGITFYLSIMIGGPGETRLTVEESIRFAIKVNASMTTFRMGIRITPLTGLHQTALEEGVVKPGQNLLEPCFYVSNSIRDWAAAFLHSNFDGNPRILIQ